MQNCSNSGTKQFNTPKLNMDVSLQQNRIRITQICKCKSVQISSNLLFVTNNISFLSITCVDKGD